MTINKREFIAWMSDTTGITNITKLTTSHLLNIIDAFVFKQQMINQRILDMNNGLSKDEIMQHVMDELKFRYEKSGK